jgi:uncharacterized protein involved in exopolysaccharide biosynthesis
MAGEEPIHPEQMRQYLRQAYAGDAEESLLWQLARKIEDPVTPQNENGNRRLHPLLLVLAAFIVVVLGAFFYFGALRT